MTHRRALSFLVVVLIFCWSPPARSESLELQAAYHVEVGKKYLASKNPQLASQEFIKALYFQPSLTSAREQLGKFLLNNSELISKDKMQQQYFLDLADYVVFLSDRVKNSMESNQLLLKLLASRQLHSGLRPEQFQSMNKVNDALAERISTPTAFDVRPDCDVLCLSDSLSQRKDRLLACLKEAESLHADLQKFQRNAMKSKNEQIVQSHSPDLLDHVKDLQLTVVRKDEIVEQQSKHIKFLDDEIGELRTQFAGLQQKFSDAEKRISLLTENLTGASLEVYQRDQRLAKKEAELAAIRGDLTELQQRGVLMQRIIQEKELKNVTAQAEQDNSSRIGALEQQFADLNKKYNDLEHSLAQKEEEVARLNEELTVKDEKIVNLKNAFVSNEQRVDELLGVVEIYKSKLGQTIKILDGVDIHIKEFINPMPNSSKETSHSRRPDGSLVQKPRPQSVPTYFSDSNLSAFSLDKVLEHLSGDLETMQKN